MTSAGRLDEARLETDLLFRMVDPAAMYERPIAERHRIIFYLGHLEAFDMNLFAGEIAGLQRFEPALDQLFAFGIDPVGGGLPADTAGDWPARRLVDDYVAQTRDRVDAALERSELPEQLLHVAIEHRLMHAETLSYMLHQLPVERLVKQGQDAAPLAAPSSADSGIEIPAGEVTLGLRRDSDAFGWDNEFEAERVAVPAFAIDRHKVSNAQFLAFVEAGGYRDRSLWRNEDWAWKESSGIAAPVSWIRAEGGWKYRAMFEEIPMPMEWPVYVSFAEACAYAQWAGKRLPTEVEWQRASEIAVHERHPRFERWDPVSVSSSGMFGNGWEWTSTAFAPLPGFAPFPFYRGYSADFFDGKHYVLKGGSTRTATCMLRPSFRNWFQPHYQYVYAGFRLCQLIS